MLERFGDKACYTYNSAGIRTEKCIQGVPTKYVVSGSTIFSETTNGVTTVYYYSADGVVGFNRGGTDYFYRKNLQGDIIAIVNASGGVVAKYVYDAWGNHKAFNATGSVIYDSTNPTAYSSYTNHVGYLNPFRYRGYYFDNETGLYYLNSRYYDPQVGRFINADTINYLNPKNFNGLNLYSYCLNNPVMLSDPMGTSVDWGKIFGWVVVAVAAVALVALATYLVTAIPVFTAMYGASSAVVTTTKILASTFVGASLGYTIGIGSSVEKQGGFTNADPLNVLRDGTVGAIIGGLSGLASGGASYLMDAMGLSFGLSVNSMRIMGVSVGSVFSSGLVINGIRNVVTIMSGLVAGTTINAIGNYAIGNNLGANSIAAQGLQGEMPMWLFSLLNWLF